jgi:hypothetical protein
MQNGDRSVALNPFSLPWQHGKKTSPWTHVDCMAKTQRMPIRNQDLILPEDISNADQITLREILSSTKIPEFVVDYAKSGNAICRGCGHKIDEVNKLILMIFSPSVSANKDLL